MTEIHSANAPDPLGAYPHARRAGDFLFLSGIGPRQPGTGDIPGNKLDDQGNVMEYDFAAQCHSVFSNVRGILENAGGKWENLVDITVFLIDMDRDFDEFNNIYSRYFATNRPCRTTVEVTALPTPIAIELKCIAYMGNKGE